MADNKEFTVGVKVSMEGIEALERKIRDLNANQRIVEQAQKSASKLEGAGLGGITPQIKESLDKAAKEYQKALGGLMGNYLKEVNAIKQAFDDQIKKSKELTAERDKQIRGSQRYLELEQQIADTKTNISANESKYNKALEKGADIFGEADKTKPPKSVGQMLQEEKGGLKGVGFAVAAAIVSSLPKMINQEGMANIVQQQGAGSAVRGTIGREMGSMFNGNINSEMAWLPEKAKAIQDAQRAQKYRQGSDMVSPFTTIAGTALGGAALGSVIGGVGAVPGAIMGGLAGVGKVGYDFMSDPRERSRMLSPFSDTQSQRYKAYQAEEFAGNFNKSLEAQKELNPAKSVAIDYQSKFGGRDLSAQRQMGLSDQGLYGSGGYYSNATSAGFTPESALAMSGQVLGAGGSTRAASQSVLALQAQRNMDLTNAGSIMGKVSGSAGGAAASEAIFKKILEASVKAGLDTSEFREEQRKFTETAANIFSQSGATTGQDADRIAQGFSRFLGNDKTLKGLEGAKSAYDEFQSGTSQTSGRGGAIQFAEIMKDDNLKGGSAKSLGGLMEIPEDQLNTNHPRIIAFAHKQGVRPEDIVNSLKKVKRNTTQREIALDPDKVKKLDEFMTKNNMDEGGQLSKSQLDFMQASDPELYNTYQDVIESGSQKSQYKDQQKVSAVARGTISSRGVTEPLPSTVDSRMGAGETGRAGDRAEQNMAIASDAMIKNFDKFKDSIIPATKAVDDFTKSLIVLSAAMANAPESDKAKMGVAVTEAAKSLYLQQAESRKGQPQSSKPPPGGR